MAAIVPENKQKMALNFLKSKERNGTSSSY
jgi:hypothetical protein